MYPELIFPLARVCGFSRHLAAILYSTTSKKKNTDFEISNRFCRIDIPNLRLGLLIGTRPGDAGDVKISFRQQVLTLRDFKEGSINCLVGSLCFS